ncbi:MAG: M28 family metallopeptidase [Defluviitaleaceae bacterium]|nr:M28 family metallopeptidase [Defluviitaleaceae bacterium]
MKIKSYAKKILALMVAFTFVAQGSITAFAQEEGESVAGQWTPSLIPEDGPRDALEQSMYFLVNTLEARLWGTANEYAAARFIEQEFLSMGITNVLFYEADRYALGAGLPHVGRLHFGEDLPDVFGVPIAHQNEQLWANPLTLPIVDLGTYPNLAIPEGSGGNFIAAVRIPMDEPDSNAHANELAFYMTELEAALNDLENINNIVIAGALIAAVGTDNVNSLTIGMNSQNHGMAAPRLANTFGIARPIIGLSLHFLEITLERASYFQYMERFQRLTDRTVLATLPASTDTPDAIIIFTSHFDSVIGSPGATDNASGASALMEIARRLVNEDRGNIEFRFGALGAHEGGGTFVSVENGEPVTSPQGAAGRSGTNWIIDNLTPEQHAIALNINMDIISSVGPSLNDPNVPIDAVSMDIFTPGSMGNDDILQFNLPAYLVVGGAVDVWTPGDHGIYNVRIFDFGGSDHTTFTDRGIDAASLIMVDDADNDLEIAYHNSRDNLVENYCYYRLLLSTNLAHNAAVRAIEQQLTKRVQFNLGSAGGRLLHLANAEQIFTTFEAIEGVVEVNGEETIFRLDRDNTTLNTRLAINPQTLVFRDIVAIGTGTADNRNQDRNELLSRFTSSMLVEIVE